MIHAVRRARKLKGIQIANSRIIDVAEDIKQLVDQSKLDALRKRFQAFDSDCSSFIDSAELTPLLQSLGFNPTEERVREILAAFDTDCTGTLTFGEFVEVWAYYCQEAQSEAELIRTSFNFLLQNDSQAISFSEFRDIMMSTGHPLTDKEVRRFFALCDDESDGILRLDEFLKVLYNQPSLDMSLTRMSDSKHDHQAIHDLFVNSNRTQRQSLASSITTRSQARPLVLESVVENQLEDSGAQHVVDTSQARSVGCAKNCGVESTGAQNTNTFEAIVEDPREACSHGSTTAAAEEPLGIGEVMANAQTSQAPAAADLAFEDECVKQMRRPVCAADRGEVQLGTRDQADCGAAAACKPREYTCAECCGVVHSCDHCDVKQLARDKISEVTLPCEPQPTGLPLRRHVPLAALPSQIHRKLEAMSAKTLHATQQRTQNPGSNN